MTHHLSSMKTTALVVLAMTCGAWTASAVAQSASAPSAAAAPLPGMPPVIDARNLYSERDRKSVV